MKNDTPWVKDFSNALELAMSSAVAVAEGRPELTLDQYVRAIWNVTQRPRLNGYFLQFRIDPDETVRLICGHPKIARIFEENEEPQEFVLTGLRSSYSNTNQRQFALGLIRHLVCSAKLSGILATARRFEEMLERSAEKDLSGLEATFVSGLSLGGRMDIAEGLSAIPYDEYRREHLGSFTAVMYDHLVQRNTIVERSGQLSPIAVILQEFRWGPAIARGSDPPTIKFRGNGGEALDVVPLINLLSVIGNLRLRVVGQERRAERWFYELAGQHLDIGLNHHHRGPVDLVPGNDNELSAKQKAEFERLAPLWLAFAEEPDKKSIGLAMSRLAGALSRAGSLAEEDKILDVAIALEILYGVQNKARLSKRSEGLLSEDQTEREHIKRIIKRFFKCRNEIVHHQSQRYDQGSMNTAFFGGFNIAVRTMRRHLKCRSMPSEEEWQRLEHRS